MTPPDWIPGRLYFDQELIPIRSDTEATVLVLLRGVLSRESDTIRTECIAGIIEFVASEEYARFVEAVERYAEQVEDANRYTVWIDCDAASRSKSIILLARVEAIGLKAARVRIDSQQPLAENISALEVNNVVGKYLAAGLTVRVDPPFPWALC